MFKLANLIAVLLVGAMSSAMAQTSNIEVDHAWARATPGGAKTAAIYLTLVNKGTAPDRLMAAATSAAGKAEIHSTTEDNGVMRMRPVDSIEVKPGMPVTFKPGGYHVMLMDLKAPLKEGQQVPLTLTFEKAGKVDVTAAVEKAGSMGTQPHDMPGMKM
jgi:periplasmic copper chaperone A